MTMGVLSRRKLAEYVASRIESGADVHHLIDQVAAYLIDTGREREVELMRRTIEIALAHRGIITAHVTSAHALSASERQAIIARIDASKVYLKETVDPSVIGGVRIETPGRRFDATIAHQLRKLAEMKA